MLVGYTIDRKNQAIEEGSDELALLEDRYAFLNDVHIQTRAVKDELLLQIADSEDSLGKIYNLTQQLNSLQPEKIYYSAVGVILAFFPVLGVIYLLFLNRPFTSLKDTIYEFNPSFISPNDPKYYVRTVDVQKESNTVPIEEALILNDNKTKRSLLMQEEGLQQ